MKLQIFSSTRQIKEFYRQSKTKNSLLDKAISVNEFLENICELDGRKASSYESLLFMQNACIKSKNLEKELGISSDFFVFLKNNAYLFSFFKELVLEKKSILDLKNSDSYASYDEHLDILEEVFHNYTSLLKEANLYDELSLVKDYKINKDFLSEFDTIIYNLEGFLSTFEADILEQSSKYSEVILQFYTSKFNIDALKELPFLKNANLEENVNYALNISKKELLKIFSDKKPPKEIRIKSFELRLAQVSFVFDEISKFIRLGLKAENIVVITPDESFCEFLRIFDYKNMLNFASGISIKESLFYKRLNALYELANLEDFVPNLKEKYFEEEKEFEYANTLLNYFKLDLVNFKAKFNENCDFVFFKNLLDELTKDENSEVISSVEKEFIYIKNLSRSRSLKLKEILELFFMQISNINLSHVGGGKVTVMGLLESRGLKFDGVVIVDFNDDFIPKRSINEMFLNNEVRKKAGLISYEKRENLQRFYYEKLIDNASNVSISYVENEEKMKSRFLDELTFKLNYETKTSQKAYLNAFRLNPPKSLNLEPIKTPILKHDFFEEPLSFSRLNCFLENKRTYYYRYVLKLQEPRMLDKTQAAKKLGIFIHCFLENFYKNFYTKEKSINETAFFALLKQEAKKQGFSEFDLAILELKLQYFLKNEKKRFEENFKVEKIELEFSKDTPKIYEINEECRAKLIGKIDRIDSKNNEFFIIDYKTGKIEDSFQLAFYQMLFDENALPYFYELSTKFELVPFNKKGYELSDLKNTLNEIYKLGKEIEFEDNAKAKYSPYKLIYKKDLK